MGKLMRLMVPEACTAAALPAGAARRAGGPLGQREAPLQPRSHQPVRPVQQLYVAGLAAETPRPGFVQRPLHAGANGEAPGAYVEARHVGAHGYEAHVAVRPP